MLQRCGKPYRIRGEQSTSFADLRDTPVILVAAFDCPWTLRVAGQLRVAVVNDQAGETDGLRHRVAGPRYQHRPTDRRRGRHCAVRDHGGGGLLRNGEYFADAVRQIVLSVPVVNRILGRPRILATHVW
jgi:hypothetical protein